MRKRHDYEALLKYMRMLEEGYSIDHIHKKFGIGHNRLKCLWLQYQKQGISVLCRKKNIQASGELKQDIVRDIEINRLPLAQASIQYGVSATRLSVWLKIFMMRYSSLTNEDERQVWEDLKRRRQQK